MANSIKKIHYVLIFYGEVCNIFLPRNCEFCKQKERGLCKEAEFLGFNLLINSKKVFENVKTIEEIETYLKQKELLNEEQINKINTLKNTDFSDSNVFPIDKSNIKFESKENEFTLNHLVIQPQLIRIILTD